MITKEEFIKFISKHQQWEKRLYEVEEVLGVFPLEMDWVEYGAILFDDTLHLLFTEKGVDWINWWLTEKILVNAKIRSKCYAYDKNNNEIPTETIDDLWDIVKDYRK